MYGLLKIGTPCRVPGRSLNPLRGPKIAKTINGHQNLGRQSRIVAPVDGWLLRAHQHRHAKGRSNMVRLVGWIVITGFSIYGLSEFVKNHVVPEKAPSPGTPSKEG